MLPAFTARAGVVHDRLGSQPVRYASDSSDSDDSVEVFIDEDVLDPLIEAANHGDLNALRTILAPVFIELRATDDEETTDEDLLDCALKMALKAGQGKAVVFL